MPITPTHEQHYPDKRLPHRLEEYVRDDGPPTQNRAYAKRVTGQQVLDAVLAAQAQLKLANIDPRYYVATCFHEAGCSNEWDTEIATASCPPGFQSVGAFQIGDEEARRYGFALTDMIDFQKSVVCMVRLAEHNRAQLRAYAKLAPGVPDPDYTDKHGGLFIGGTMRAYLAIAHNHGCGYARLSIAKYGMDWGAYIDRNPTDNIVAHGYGTDCVTGGPQCPASAGGPVHPPAVDRVLRLTTPRMTGDDVRDLQRHLKITADGDYGPVTAAAVKAFQAARGLVGGDDSCGPETWAVLRATP